MHPLLLATEWKSHLQAESIVLQLPSRRHTEPRREKRESTGRELLVLYHLVDFSPSPTERGKRGLRR